MKILITGGSGLLGQHLNLQLSRNNEILTLYNNNSGNCRQFNSRRIDIRNKKELSLLFKEFLPDAVIHTAAITNSSTTLPPGEVYRINVISTADIAELCSEAGSKLIYTSTDLVYAGYRGSMLKEDSKLIPVSLYAETKLMGEEKIKQTFSNYLILRTALLYGFGYTHSVNHFHRMYDDLKSDKSVDLFTDQYRTPLSLPEAASIIEQLCITGATGIVNLGGRDRVSRYELGEILCDAAGFNKELLNGIKMSSIEGYPAVEDVSMNTDKLLSFGVKLISIRDSISNLLKT